MSSFRRGARKPYARPTSRADVDGQWLHDKAPTGPRAADVSRPRIPTAPAPVNSKLLVSNLHYDITPKDLTAIFGQIGTLVREPLIRYDRSGRSSGTAIIAYETATEATRAKKQFDGILAKGQPMSIAFDTMPPRPARRSVSVPTLINRIQKPPLLERLSRDDTNVKPSVGPRSVGPIRSRPIRGVGGAARPPRGPKKPKTAEELDKELDAFMGDAEPLATAEPAAEPTQPEPVVQDVEMA
ncbi:putative RNA recognition motif containing protein [Lyophyllum shimeji]|uniref:RNA recognition motif containing protein n=1 Tax=Lyophyllum shimeji TaxID=47721 RepID=A0A9P3PST2_LYOSH|nr:putative RNA recognition motif containing protein [Lyophyllum shimeji]